MTQVREGPEDPSGVADGDGVVDVEGTPEAPTLPRWVPWLAFLLCLAGLGDAIYLTYDHFTGKLPICSAHGFVNCALVTTSAQSEIFGHIPVALLGLLFYVAMTAVNIPAVWQMVDRRIAWLRVGMAASGIGMVIYLLVVELYQLRAICLWCTGVHVVTFLLFILIVATAPLMARRQAWAEWEAAQGDDQG